MLSLFRETTAASLVLSTFTRDAARSFLRAVLAPPLSKVVDDNLVASNQTVRRSLRARVPTPSHDHDANTDDSISISISMWPHSIRVRVCAGSMWSSRVRRSSSRSARWLRRFRGPWRSSSMSSPAKPRSSSRSKSTPRPSNISSLQRAECALCVRACVRVRAQVPGARELLLPSHPVSCHCLAASIWHHRWYATISHTWSPPAVQAAQGRLTATRGWVCRSLCSSSFYFSSFVQVSLWTRSAFGTLRRSARCSSCRQSGASSMTPRLRSIPSSRRPRIRSSLHSTFLPCVYRLRLLLLLLLLCCCSCLTVEHAFAALLHVHVDT